MKDSFVPRGGRVTQAGVKPAIILADTERKGWRHSRHFTVAWTILRMAFLNNLNGFLKNAHTGLSEITLVVTGSIKIALDGIICFFIMLIGCSHWEFRWLVRNFSVLPVVSTSFTFWSSSAAILPQSQSQIRFSCWITELHVTNGKSRVELTNGWTLILIITAALASTKTTTKPVMFTADGTAMPKLLLGREDEWGPSARSVVVTGRVGRPAKGEAIISLRWSFCQELKPATQYTFQGQIKGSLYTCADADRARSSGLPLSLLQGVSYSTCVFCFTELAEINLMGKVFFSC